MLSVVRAEAHEERHISITQPREVTEERLGMGEELQTAVATQVVLHTAVDATTLACGEILEAQGEGLLILLEALPTLGVE